MEPRRDHWYLKEVKSHVASSTHVKVLRLGVPDSLGKELIKQHRINLFVTLLHCRRSLPGSV